MAAYFSPDLFTFLRSLKRHNDRTWFAAHRERYVAAVEAPMQQFIADFGHRLRGVSRAYVADPKRSGGSMFRIYRDTRFSNDKRPFKTWAAARFSHEARHGRALAERSGARGAPRATPQGGPAGQRPPGEHEARKERDGVPSFYLHLEPGDSYGGGGVYHIDMPGLTRIRQHIAAAPRQWAAVLETGIDIEGDRLSRAPAGFDPADRFIEDLKRKDFYTLKEFTDADVVSDDFLDRYVAACERAAPLVEFLTKALGLRW